MMGFCAYSGRCRSAFRGDGDRDSEVMPITDSDLMAITIPPGCRSLFGDLRNGDRHQRNHLIKPFS
jgi:hypothetical protein